MTLSSDDPGADRARLPWVRRVTLHTLLAGLCPLIPVPFLDDSVLRAVRRRQVRELALATGTEVEPSAVDLLAGLDRGARSCGCLLGFALALPVQVAVRLVAKVFRRITVVLAVHEAVNTASRVFHEGYLLHLALDGRTAVDTSEAVELREAVEATCQSVDTRPVQRILRRLFHDSRRLLVRTARVLARRPASTNLSEAEGSLAALGDRLAGDLGGESVYLRSLSIRFEEELASGRHTASPADASVFR